MEFGWRRTAPDRGEASRAKLCGCDFPKHELKVVAVPVPVPHVCPEALNQVVGSDPRLFEPATEA